MKKYLDRLLTSRKRMFYFSFTIK